MLLHRKRVFEERILWHQREKFMHPGGVNESKLPREITKKQEHIVNETPKDPARTKGKGQQKTTK